MSLPQGGFSCFLRASDFREAFKFECSFQDLLDTARLTMFFQPGFKRRGFRFSQAQAEFCAAPQ